MNSIVVKVGGAFLDDPKQAQPLLKVLSEVQSSNKVVLVHGGGNAVESLLKQLGQSSEKIDGLRVTPATQIDYVVGALAGTVNKNLCSMAIQSGLNPVGLSLADGKMTTSEQIHPKLGCVGQVLASQSDLLELLLDKHYLPIVSSIGVDAQGNLLNINADQAATALAKALHADLFLLSDVPGVLDDNKQLIDQLNPQQLETLIKQGVVRDGMVVKVNAALSAANTLGRPVTIASWRTPEALFAQSSQTSLNSGTQIIPNTVQQEAL